MIQINHLAVIPPCRCQGAFFCLLLVFLLFPLAGRGSEGSEKPLKHDGFLRLYHSHSHEFLEVVYERNGVINEGALKRINHFMRSRDSGKETKMDPDLIRLIDHLQDHFGADTVEVICGFRSPEFNRALKMAGKGVAEQSNHIRGIAADIHLDEISEKKVQAYARRLGIGGVGYYPDQLMVHVDLGRVHFWQDGNFSDRTDIGIFTDLPVTLKTDRLFYFLGEKMRLVLSNPQEAPLNEDLRLEHFFRGKWNNSPLPLPRSGPFGIKLPHKGATSSREGEGELLFDRTFPYGKFRWKIETEDGRVQYSNEFYVKKK
ncbi:MAG: YcbK family protein [Deltaproteobacteria bacterium]|nr:YcbK family protein [Deltaproteobacteria bacterium]